MSEEPARITVSRDALRADLAEMELRLRVYFDEQLKHKADHVAVTELALKLDSLDRGDFTPVHRRALEDFVTEMLSESRDKAWSRKEKIMATISAVVTVAWGMLSFILVSRGGTL